MSETPLSATRTILAAMDARRSETPADLAKHALDHLTAARDLLKAAGCSSRLIDKVRLAISSAKGAVRHADNKRFR